MSTGSTPTPQARPGGGPDPAAPVEPPPAASAEAASPGPQGTPPRPASRYAMGSASNMIRSMLVVGALVLLLVLMVPRVSSVGGPPVDVHKTALEVKQETGWPIVEAVDLPEGWSETSARYVRSSDGRRTWHAGYQTPGGRYAAVEQTKDATDFWVRTQTNRAPAMGRREIDGATWTWYVRDQKIQNSLVNRATEAGAMTTLVTGTATEEELRVLIDHLAPVR